MFKEKQFPILKHPSGAIVLKEQTHRHTSGDDVKFTLTYALNSDLQLVEPKIEHKNTLIDVETYAQMMGIEKKEVISHCKKNSKPLYYLITDLVYIGEHTLSVVGDTIERNKLAIYIPFDFDTRGKLKCRDVSLNFPPQGRKQVTKTNAHFVLERL